jgi:hypothetical protein
MIWGPGTGKNALQKKVDRSNLRSRSRSDPLVYRLFDFFNDHLGEAEYWRLSDPKWSTRKERENFANACKSAISESRFAVHPKFQQERSLEVFKRVTISMNNEDEPMSIFPLLPESTIEKLIFITTADQSSSFSPTALNWPDWQRKVRSELPAFLFDTIYNFRYP